MSAELILILAALWPAVIVLGTRVTLLIHARVERKRDRGRRLDYTTTFGSVLAGPQLSEELRGEIYQTMEWWDREFNKLCGIEEPKGAWGSSLAAQIAEQQRRIQGMLSETNGDMTYSFTHPTDPKPPTTAELWKPKPSDGYDPAVNLANLAAASQVGVLGPSVAGLAIERAMELKKSKIALEALECENCEYTEIQTYANLYGNQYVEYPCEDHRKKFEEIKLAA